MITRHVGKPLRVIETSKTCVQMISLSTFLQFASIGSLGQCVQCRHADVLPFARSNISGFQKARSSARITLVTGQEELGSKSDENNWTWMFEIAENLQ